MLDFFISPAMAQDAGAAGGGMAQIIMLGGFVLIFYFLLWHDHDQLAFGRSRRIERIDVRVIRGNNRNQLLRVKHSGAR